MAVGTLALASVTAGLALVTNRLGRATQALGQLTSKEVDAVTAEAAASREQAELTRSANEATIRPLLIDVPVTGELEEVVYDNVGMPVGAQIPSGEIDSRDEGTDGETLISVPFRNVGSGAAVLAAPHPALNLSGGTSWLQGQATRRVVPAGETVRVNFRLSTIPSSPSLYVMVAYSDVAGGQLTRTHLFLVTRGASLHVAGVAIYPGGHDPNIAPTFTSGQGWD